MVSNLPGSPIGLTNSGAAQTYHREKQKAEAAPNAYISLDDLLSEPMPKPVDRFEKRGSAAELDELDSPPWPSSPNSPDSDDDQKEFEKFLKDIYEEEALRQRFANLRIATPRPGLHRTESFRVEHTYPPSRAMHAPEVFKPPEPGALAMPIPKRPSSAEPVSPKVQEFLNSLPFPAGDAVIANQQVARPPRRHRRSNLVPGEAQAAVKAFQKKRAQNVFQIKLPFGVQYASQAQLLQIFEIPYHYVLLGHGKVYPFLKPEQAAASINSAGTIAVGDMHASFLKLMETLVTANMVEMPAMSARKFKLLAHMANMRDLDPEQLILVNNDLHKIISTMRWKGGDRKLILIGDMLSDRGPLDTVTLDIMEHLSKQAPNSFIRLASNHDHNVLGHQIRAENGILAEQTPSMLRAIDLAASTGKLAELSTQYFDYLGQSKLMHFDPETKTLFSHAPISMKQLRKLSPLLRPGTPNVDDVKTLEDVSRFVDAANTFYKDYVRQNRRVLEDAIKEQKTGKPQQHIHKDIRLMNRRKQVEPILVSENGFLWTRNVLDKEEELPFKKAGVQTLVHGHDMNSLLGSPFSIFKTGEDKRRGFTVATLDQHIRKGTEEPDSDEINSLYLQA